MARKPYKRIMPEGYKGPAGVVTFIVAYAGYAMIRRPNAAPFVVSVKDWNEWQEVTAAQPSKGE